MKINNCETDIKDTQNISWEGYDSNGRFRLSTGEEYNFVLETINEQNEPEVAKIIEYLKSTGLYGEKIPNKPAQKEK